ncbi:hypothetical protein Bcell_3982 [Evansella cellulosilytica DSM 2522]|uniref:Uncharacterized protein n=1 Tax=Evansella cellulosilytica (strain ATCC 21833 / DSM 2522 / FERM P-1141 / JCM 9156 / N-4) TaxID=649639 RepID=E6TWF1_EVAC2|nr:hypothetical protein Bcell_3982 [Evansella cellulosilytica DSM 2522]
MRSVPVSTPDLPVGFQITRNSGGIARNFDQIAHNSGGIACNLDEIARNYGRIARNFDQIACNSVLITRKSISIEFCISANEVRPC